MYLNESMTRTKHDKNLSCVSNKYNEVGLILDDGALQHRVEHQQSFGEFPADDNDHRRSSLIDDFVLNTLDHSYYTKHP